MEGSSFQKQRLASTAPTEDDETQGGLGHLKSPGSRDRLGSQQGPASQADFQMNTSDSRQTPTADTKAFCALNTV